MKHLVISDLHLNMGKMEGQLHPLEDFDSDPEFEALLDLIANFNGELIINGDWVDFLQLEPFVPLGHYRSTEGIPLAWTAAVAAQKLETCLCSHQRHFSALATFLRSGGRCTVLQGNHDPDWFFPASTSVEEPPIQKQLRQALGNPRSESLTFVPTSVRRGSVHIEHGHQQCEWANAFQDHPDIFHTDRANVLLGERRFELLWGSRFVLEFFNGLETTHPYADNLKPTTGALVLGIRNGWVSGDVAADALRFFWGSGIKWRDVGELLDNPKQTLELIQGLENDELKAAFFQRLSADPKFQQELSARVQDFPDEDKEQFRRHNPTERAAAGEVEIIPSQEPDLLGVFRRRRELRNAARLLKQQDVTAVVFGHTHQEVDGNDAHLPVRNYFNTGTWTPRFDLRNPENRQLLKSAHFPKEILQDRNYFDVRLLYVEVTVAPDGTRIELKEIQQGR